jgi:hypothetical protein
MTTFKPSREIVLQNTRIGLGMLLLGIAMVVGGAVLAPRLPIAGVPVIVMGVLVLIGLTIVNPNDARVITLFGRYIGTVRTDGFHWVNPFTMRRKISLKAHNFDSSKLKVNDLNGNPIEIGAVVVWRVRDTVQAMFDVEDHVSYVAVQSESALRAIAATHPYDSVDQSHSSLRGSADIVNSELNQELHARLAIAGIEVLEARLSHLAYAPEIAGAMLQRQQAEAIIAARSRIVDGAVGMVKMALEHLDRDGVIQLDAERKASMVSNLLVVLCSERAATPIVNTGTLYT